MSLQPKVISQTVTPNPTPVLVRGSTAITYNYFIKLKNYVVAVISTNIWHLYKITDDGLKYVKQLPQWNASGGSGYSGPIAVGNNNVYVTKDCKNASITLNFIDVNTDEITQSNICVSTSTDNGYTSYHIDVVGENIYVATVEGASLFLYSGALNITNKTVTFTKKTIATATVSTISWINVFFMYNDNIGIEEFSKLTLEDKNEVLLSHVILDTGEYKNIKPLYF